MAGKRQHYVPRLLQRGFLDNPSDEAERTWLHRHGAKAQLVGIRDVGVEDWFYSRKSLDGTPTLDDLITDLERDLGACIGALRACPPGGAVDAAEAARTVVHLVIRTAHLRRIVSAGITGIVDEIQSIFTDPARLGRMIGIAKPTFATVVLDAICNSAAELVPAGIPSTFSERLIAFELREVGDRLIEQMVETLAPVFPQLFGGLASIVRDAHNSFLATTPESNGWMTALAALKWTVEAGVDLILPDAVALAVEGGGQLMPLLFTTAADVRAVVMPISADRILVGLVEGSAPIDFSNFNIHAAASCESFFIGAKPFDENKLSTLIGSATAREIEEAVLAAVREAVQVRSTAGTTIAPSEPHAFTQRGFSFSVRLADFGDGVLAKEFADVVHGVVTVLARHHPLHELDGITLAIDYHGALATVDRGDPSMQPATSGALSYGLGVAKPIAVIRNGAHKEHLVIAAGLAEMWLSSDPGVRSSGLYTLVKMLVGVAHSTRYASARKVHFSPDAMARMLHSAVAPAPSGYWSAREAAFIEPDQGQVYADLVIDSLDFTEREIANERAHIPESGDIGNTTRRALECVSAILGHAADWLGHRDGLTEGQAFAGRDLPERLRVRGLDRWIELFGRDLAACYSSEDALDIEVVASLSQHVERLFWSFGIYCWPFDNDIQCLVTDRFFFPPPL